jgi:hypothetical protein
MKAMSYTGACYRFQFLEKAAIRSEGALNGALCVATVQLVQFVPYTQRHQLMALFAPAACSHLASRRTHQQAICMLHLLEQSRS